MRISLRTTFRCQPCALALVIASQLASSSILASDPREFLDGGSTAQSGWQGLEDRHPRPVASDAWASFPAPPSAMTEVEPVTNLIPVQALELPELPIPVVDAASAQLVSPRIAPPAAPVMLSPPDLAVANDEIAPAYAAKPLTPVAAEGSSASSEDLEGMLHGMVWVTGTIGLGAVLSLWMLRMWLMRGGRSTSPSRSLKLIETLRIGPKCGVYLVQAESHRVLVGIEHGKSMCLMPLPASFTESLDAAGEDESAAPQPAGGFERVADVFAALRQQDERSKGASS